MTSFSYLFKGGTHIVTSVDNVQMLMLVRKKKEFFTDFIANEAKAKALKVAVNGSYIDLTFGSSVAVLTKSDPLDPSEATPIGQVIQDGKLLAGTNSTGKFNFSQDTCGTQKFSASLGNPPKSACSAIGGIAPILVGGLAYGAQNLYRAGVPSGAPLTGDVDAKFRPYLTQKSNAMFSKLLSLGGEVGKVAIGYSNSTQKLVVLAQEHGKTGFDANGIRTIFIGAGVNNAVFLDCSDSATLFYDGKLLAKPGTNKNEFLTIAVGFK